MAKVELCYFDIKSNGFVGNFNSRESAALDFAKKYPNEKMVKIGEVDKDNQIIVNCNVNVSKAVYFELQKNLDKQVKKSGKLLIIDKDTLDDLDERINEVVKRWINSYRIKPPINNAIDVKEFEVSKFIEEFERRKNRKRGFKISEENIEKMIKMESDGVAITYIAETIGVSIQTVNRYIKINKENNESSLEDLDLDYGKINALHKARWKDSDIARDLRVSVESISNYLDGRRLWQ